MKKTLESYKGFEQFKQLVDVGGGLGTTLSVITSKYPHIKAINFDLPHVINDAPSYPGVEHLSGDMFQSVPKGDAIILKSVLNAWDDNNCLSHYRPETREISVIQRSRSEKIGNRRSKLEKKRNKDEED
ncbi:hypothetical protein LWI29_015755 [Acer saccharum]|uniref:O-methyltransferase C-terminal domain-containing protein n=1 Tax=Acer saccharum TaxID=4024 RepID=A0AA39RWZ0_ACESA|nr:hypothetical protein LWI29_015755 [Acer saccharum]